MRSQQAVFHDQSFTTSPSRHRAKGFPMQAVYSQEEVIQALETVLHDPKFAAAPQMSAFLKFVVMQTL